VLTTRKALDFIYKTKYDGVGLRVKRLSFEPLDKYYKDPYLHTGTFPSLLPTTPDPIVSLAEISDPARLEQVRQSEAQKVDWSARTFSNPSSDATLTSIDIVLYRFLIPMWCVSEDSSCRMAR